MKFIRSVLFTLISLAVSRECYPLQQNRANRIRRIENGDSICIANVPYHVIIKVKGSYKCGGALIRPNFVLTAAHCAKIALASKSTLFVVAGQDSTTLEAGLSFPDESIEIASEHIRMHSSYDPSRQGNILQPLTKSAVHDLALIKLTKEFPITKRIKPISLPKQSVEIGDKLIVTGTGRINLFTKSTCLRFYKPKVVDCSLYDKRMPSLKNIFCHKGEWGERTHVGDSGSPVVNDRNELVGIHKGTQTYDCQAAVNVYYYLDWIDKTMKKLQKLSNMKRVRNDENETMHSNKKTKKIY